MLSLMVWFTSSCEGQISFKYTGSPLGSYPRGSLMRSISTRPTSAYATTSMGDIKKFIFTCGCTLASKFRFPESTEQTTSSFSSTALAIAGGKGPELPIQEVQP